MPTVSKLTDSAVRSAMAERQKRGLLELLLWDLALPGFGVRIAATGSTFVVKYALGGRGARQRKMKIGRFGPLNAHGARSIAQQILQRVARGEDPAGERETRRNDPTLSQLLDDFLLQHVDAKRKPRTAAEYRRQAEKLIKPAMGKLRIKEVETPDVTRLHHRLATKPTARSPSGTPHQANRVVALLSKFFNWCESQGYRPKFSNPAKGVEKYAEHGRERYLSPTEIMRLGTALTESSEWPTAIAAIRLLIFTGARHTEITTLRWDQVDMLRGLARIESKTGTRNIPLPAPALRVLADLPRRADNPFVIWGRKSGSYLVGLQGIWERVREAAHLPGVHIHDLRHTNASIAVQGGASLRILGALLGHRSVLTTGRYAHVADDPAQALAERVGGEIEALFHKGANAKTG